MKAFITSLSLGLLLSAGASAQQATRTAPVEGIRDNGTGYHALVGAGGDVGPTHWNPQVRAWFSTTANLQDDADRRRRDVLALLADWVTATVVRE